MQAFTSLNTLKKRRVRRKRLAALASTDFLDAEIPPLTEVAGHLATATFYKRHDPGFVSSEFYTIGKQHDASILPPALTFYKGMK